MPSCFATIPRMALLETLLCLSLAACGGGGDLDTEDRAIPAAGGGGTAPPDPPPTTAGSPGTLAFPLAASDLSAISRPFGTLHEASPAGVPVEYDWSRVSKPDRINEVPAGYTAFTGWGQAFWITGATAGTQALEIRDNQTYLCTVSTDRGAQRRWVRVQQGAIEGAAFRGDFAGNQNVAAQTVSITANHSRINFPVGRAYHYWPSQGRITLNGEALCGVVVAFQARAVAPDGTALASDSAPTMLIGGGADYWVNLTAPWRNYETNIGVGVGQLRRVTPQWRWFGMGTASASDQQLLLNQGYVDRTRQ